MGYYTEDGSYHFGKGYGVIERATRSPKKEQEKKTYSEQRKELEKAIKELESK